MKRNTALRHVTELAAEADRLARRPGELRVPLSELWVGDDLLGETEQYEWVKVVLRLDLPADEFPYLSVHPDQGLCEHLLNLTKRPVDAHWRARGVPPWNQTVRRVARVWSAEAGTDEQLLDRLRDRNVPDELIESPTPQELRSSLEAALPVSERHLAQVLDGYWDRDWRHDHKGFGIYPEDHLWRAAEAVRSIREALSEQSA